MQPVEMYVFFTLSKTFNEKILKKHKLKKLSMRLP